MDAPLYFYYELHNFYQNHRRYVKSKNDDQLRGKGNNEVTDCEPMKKRHGKKLVGCGLVAGSFFEDRFTMSVNGESLCPNNCTNYGQDNSVEWRQHWQDWHESPNWVKHGIAWDSDVDTKFDYKKIDNETQTQVGSRQETSGLRLPDVDDEDFIVWMRVAALPEFKKLHRIVKKQDLKKGDVVTVMIFYCIILCSNHFFRKFA